MHSFVARAFPVTMVMPSTSKLGDCRKTIIAIWLEPPGPEPSWWNKTEALLCDGSL